MNRIDERLNELKKENKKAFITYMTAGLPYMQKDIEIIKIQAEAGIDIVEIGIPFSDPIADGPVIQDASYKAIQNGADIYRAFAMVKDLRKECNVPIVFMLYYNTVMHFGIETFIKTCVDCGVDGLIIPNLPFEESFEIKEAIEKTQNAPHLIPLVSPVSKDRIPMIVENAEGFVYCVSSMGVTGQNAQFHKDIKKYLESVKKASKVPVMMGFGIRRAEDVIPFKDVIDGCIVGSYFIDIMEKSDFDLDIIKEYISTFKEQLNQ